jgi:hypothetical protein
VEIARETNAPAAARSNAAQAALDRACGKAAQSHEIGGRGLQAPGAAGDQSVRQAVPEEPRCARRSSISRGAISDRAVARRGGLGDEADPIRRLVEIALASEGRGPPRGG